MPDTPSEVRWSSAMLGATLCSSWPRMVCATGGLEHSLPKQGLEDSQRHHKHTEPQCPANSSQVNEQEDVLLAVSNIISWSSSHPSSIAWTQTCPPSWTPAPKLMFPQMPQG